LEILLENFSIPFVCFSSHIVADGEVDMDPKGIASLTLTSQLPMGSQLEHLPASHLVLPMSGSGESVCFHGAVARTFINTLMNFAELGVTTLSHTNPPASILIAQLQPRNDRPVGEGILMWYTKEEGYHVAIFAHVRSGIEVIRSMDWLPSDASYALQREVRLNWNVRATGAREPTIITGIVAEALCLSYLIFKLHEMRIAHGH
jgi:hypothetical protein